MNTEPFIKFLVEAANLANGMLIGTNGHKTRELHYKKMFFTDKYLACLTSYFKSLNVALGETFDIIETDAILSIKLKPNTPEGIHKAENCRFEFKPLTNEQFVAEVKEAQQIETKAVEKMQWPPKRKQELVNTNEVLREVEPIIEEINAQISRNENPNDIVSSVAVNVAEKVKEALNLKKKTYTLTITTKNGIINHIVTKEQMDQLEKQIYAINNSEVGL